MNKAWNTLRAISTRIRPFFISPVWGGIAGMAALLGVMVAAVALIPPVHGGLVKILVGPTSTPRIIVVTPTASVPSPTGTVFIPTPTNTATPIPPTATPWVKAPAETLPESITLQCDSCSDPVLITINQIVVQPAQNRMLWTLSYNNTSQSYYEAVLGLTLQEGEQTNHTFTPTGPVDQALRAGASTQIILTFSFIPYQGESYPLTSELSFYDGLTAWLGTIDFNSVSFQF